MAHPFETNPFSDPAPSPSSSIAYSSLPASDSASKTRLDDYNPFAASSSASTTPKSGESIFVQEKLSSREEQLAQREKELARREAAVQQKEQNLSARASSLAEKEPNWPFKRWAFTYHNIEEEIPPDKRLLCKQFYAICLGTWIALFWNFICMTTIWLGISSKDLSSESTPASDFLFSVIYMCTGVWGSWSLWYRPLYFGFRDSSNTRYVMFFLVFIAHICFCIVMALGAPKSAAAGLITLIDVFKSDATIGILVVFGFIFWSSLLIASIYFIRKIYSIYVSQGGLERTRQDASSFLSSATATVATEALKQSANPVTV